MATVTKIKTELEVNVAAGATSDIYEFWDDVSLIVVTVSFPNGPGKGKIQTSTDIHDTLVSGSPVWIDWDDGEVAVTTRAIAYSPNALRVVNTGNKTMKVTVRGNVY